MKKTFLLLSSFVYFSLMAQCIIVGKETINFNQKTEAYTSDLSAQCNECYQWTTSDKNISFEGSTKLKGIKINAVSAGQTTITVSALTSKGLDKCSKTINIISSEPMPTQTSSVATKKCDVDITDFKDVKVSESLYSFFPSLSSSNYTYIWTITLKNGEHKESNEKIPQFIVSSENQITSAKVRIKSNMCYKEISKNYSENYWVPTTENVQKIEQRTYEPISYEKYANPIINETKTE